MRPADPPPIHVKTAVPRLIGTKLFAYEVSTREKRFANEAKKKTPYRVREGYCHRVDEAGGCYFRFYPDAWHAEHGFSQRPGGGGGGEGPAHDEAVDWIAENLRLGAAFNDSPLYLRFSEACVEFWTGVRRPDIRAVVAECWPPVVAAGDVIFVEVCLSSPVTPDRKRDLAAERVPTIELVLDKALLEFADGDELRRRVREELVGCPFGRWIVHASGGE